MYKFYQPLALLVLLTSLLGTACSDDDSPEQQIRNYIAAGKLAAESRDLSDFKQLIADDFSDVQGHDKATLVRIAAGYFLRNKNIHLFTQINDIHFPHPDQADVRLYIAMTGQAVNDINSIFNLRADLYEFELKLLRQDGDWLLHNARWSRVRQDSL